MIRVALFSLTAASVAFAGVDYEIMDIRAYASSRYESNSGDFFVEPDFEFPYSANRSLSHPPSGGDASGEIDVMWDFSGTGSSRTLAFNWSGSKGPEPDGITGGGPAVALSVLVRVHTELDYELLGSASGSTTDFINLVNVQGLMNTEWCFSPGQGNDFADWGFRPGGCGEFIGDWPISHRDIAWLINSVTLPSTCNSPVDSCNGEIVGTLAPGDYQFVLLSGTGGLVVAASGLGEMTLVLTGSLTTTCNDADVSEPFGLLDLADINTFTAGFLAQNPIADLNADGLHDLADISLFIDGFLAGCP